MSDGSCDGVVVQVLTAMPHGGVAFYNCGEHSGRSQPHKHVQVGCVCPALRMAEATKPAEPQVLQHTGCTADAPSQAQPASLTAQEGTLHLCKQPLL